MDKTMNILLCCLFIITLCNGISKDYFPDIEEQKSEDRNENAPATATIREEQLLLKPILRTNTSIHHLPFRTHKFDISDDDDYKTYDTDGSLINNDAGKHILGAEYRDNDELPEIEPQVTRAKTLLNIIKDYVYHYDDRVTAHQALRDQMTELEIETEITITTEANEGLVTEPEEETSEKLLIDFYNLHPANTKFQMGEGGKYFDIKKYVNRSIWYVPESLPCWDLPILYAEFGKRKEKDVFLTFGSKLRNVIEKYEEEKYAHKKINIPVSQGSNKWCSADPCYGDHTLCLFPDSTYSKLCFADYEVIIPTMVERMALVNTVNSMRNRIANGVTDLYKHLPPATDMRQMIYDFDLQTMAAAWLRQCLPGPSACSSIDGNYVAQLECTKYTENCCVKSYRDELGSKCIPHRECFIPPIIGSIHTWFRSAVDELTVTDIECGHITPATFNTVQLIWAETNKIGCAYGQSPYGDVRVVCNFAPGAPFTITTKSFCGFIRHKVSVELDSNNITDADFLMRLGISLRNISSPSSNSTEPEYKNIALNHSLRFNDIDILSKIYPRRWIRNQLNNYSNGTIGMIARLVTKYHFGEDSGPQCDTSKHIYEPGEPGSMCVETGRRFHGLCHDFREPTPGYRAVAVLAPVALFTLILYDLFSGVVRQTNY